MIEMIQKLTTVIFIFSAWNELTHSFLQNDFENIKNKFFDDENKRQPKIVGGIESPLGSGPWTVSIHKNNLQICGGSIYNKWTIITAAHCILGASSEEIRIRYNSLKHESGGELRDTIKLILHPDYDFLTNDNDIGLIYLRTPLKLGQKQAQAITMPPLGSDPKSGATVTAYGWGMTHEDRFRSGFLREVKVHVISRSNCKYAYESKNIITSNMICAGESSGGKDSCHGDSGGPLVNCAEELVGITSFGIGCGRPEYPSVYTRVGKYVIWIRNTAAYHSY